MRNKGSSKQLNLIIILMIILIVLMCTLVCVTLLDRKSSEAVNAPSHMESEESSVSIEEASSQSYQEESSEENSQESQQESIEESSAEPKEEVKPPKKPYVPPVQPVISHKVFDKEGASYEAREIIKNGYITNGNIALRNRTFNENLYITADAKDKPIVLQNVIVKGKILVAGSGKVTLHDVAATEVEIATANRNNELIVSGASTIERLTLKSSCSVDESGVKAPFAGVKEIVIEKNPGLLWIDADLSSSDVNRIYVNEISNVTVDRESSVGTVIAIKMLHLGGAGEVKKLDVYTNGVTYYVRPTEISINQNADCPSYSKEKINLVENKER